MVARQSAIYAGFVGDDSLLPAIVEALVEHNERLRVQMSANKALSLYPKEKVEKTIEDFYAKVDRLNENEEKKTITKKPGKNVCTRGKSPSDLDGCSCTGSKTYQCNPQCA